MHRISIALVLSCIIIVGLSGCQGRSGEGEGSGEGSGEGEGEGSGEGEGEGSGEGSGEGEGEGEGEREGEGAVTVVEGVFCDTAQRRGFVNVVEEFGTLRLDARIDAAVPNTLGTASLAESPCANYTPTSCATACASDEVCGYDGTCEAPVEAVANASVTVRSAAGSVTATPNSSGRIEAELVAAENGAYIIEVSVPPARPFTFAASMPVPLTEVTFADNGDGLEPATVDFAWDAANDGAAVHLFLKPNHHRPVGFSECRFDDSVSAHQTSAAMIRPLRFVTGFEGGTATRAHVAAATTATGCIEVRIGTATLIEPGF